MNRIGYLLPLLALGALAAPAAHAQGYGYNSYTSGQCREFTQTVTVNGQPTAAYGTSCLQPDGSWQIMNSSTDGYAQPATYQTVTTQQYVQPQPVYVAQPVYYPEPAPYYGGYGYGGVPVSIGLGFGFGGHGGGWHR